MAQKRMLSMNIIDTDMFIQMPISARLLYYDFCMRADDDGFIDSPTKIMKMIGCTEDDLKILIAKNYLIPFKNKVCVIRHWLIHNTIRKDRYNPTIHLEERNQLAINNKIYDFQGENVSGNHLATIWQPSIDKNSYYNSNNILEQSTENIFEIIEKEFGRLLSPLEIEMIQSWDYPIEILKLAVQQASTSGQFVIKYIDKILYNWSKANVRTVEDAKKYIANFRNKKERNNQLDERNSSTYYEEL
ncbi:predicted protein [Mycoplasma sp. CAG:877]|nr:predicted protein [Mycoplasma sp. CAG:877]